jgi:hypothetical protein
MAVAKKAEETKNEEAKDKTKSEDTTQSGSAKTESFRIQGEQLLKKVNDLIKEGNVRRITIKDKNGKNLVVLPAAIAPVLAGVGAIAALIGECTITVERE